MQAGKKYATIHIIETFSGFLLCIMLFLLISGCAQQHSTKTYTLMEKQMADMPKRHRTTAKVVVRDSGKMENTLKQVLEDLRHDDPELDAVLVWAYKNRSELNQTFTLGKLEWSKDKKGWDGKQNLAEEIQTEVSQ